ncbi:PLD nuclease N-terminal domain-containing protein [Arthrobacter sp. TMT4-20]
MAVLALMLFIAALIDILRTQHLTSSTKVAWVLATLIFPFFGPAAWFLFGRRSAPADSEPLVNSR